MTMARFELWLGVEGMGGASSEGFGYCRGSSYATLCFCVSLFFFTDLFCRQANDKDGTTFFTGAVTQLTLVHRDDGVADVHAYRVCFAG